MMGFFKKNSFYPVVLFVSTLYYLPFVNLGLDFGDEGHVLYAAKRILLGDVPYKDFYWVYVPGQAITLSMLFKVFSPEVIIGRYYTLLLHLGILLMQSIILMRFTIPRHIVFTVILASMAFGLPLTNVPYVALPGVLISLGIVLVWLKLAEKSMYSSIIVLGTFSGAILFFKQNIGMYYYGVLSILFAFRSYKDLNEKVFRNALFHIVFWFLTFAWVYPLFLESNLQGLKEFLGFSFFFKDSFLFTYPPISLLLEPFGVFKLLPYYVPVAAAIYFLYLYAFTKINRNTIIPLFFALVGFGGNMYPGTDLLHLYPFYSSVLVGLSIILYTRKHVRILYCLLLLNILIGVYLTFFRGHLRYEEPYIRQNIPLNVNYGKYIYTYQSKAYGTQELIKFMNENTTREDKILVYPFSPMVYFFLDNKNISKDSVFHPSTATLIRGDLEDQLKGQKYYIITIGNYINDTSYSHFISRQKKVFTSEFYRVYRVD